VTKEAIQMDNSYAQADAERSYLTNKRYTSRLADTMLSTDPGEWPITEAELQWLYSLGISYGLSDSDLDQVSEDNDATDMAENADD
jgi:hypothetical protein